MTPLVVIVAIAAGALILGAVLYGTRGTPNEPPALGTNRPWPSNVTPYWPPTDEDPRLQHAVHPSRIFRRRRRR